MNKNNLVVEREKLSYSMSRVFNAPRERVWKVMNDPALLPQWWGPSYLTTTIDKLEFRTGGV
jgi:uncharacterized protein YndB with AHSA1/START domain